MPSDYSPLLFVGVKHTSDNIDPVNQILAQYVKRGTRVGTEAYAYPLDTGFYNEDCAGFFNGIGDFVLSHEGLYLPLMKREDFIKQQEGIDYILREIKQLFPKIDAKLKKKDNAGNDSPTSRMLWDSCWGRLSYLYGSSQKRDNTLLELVNEKKPEIIVAGMGHIPTILIPYPNIKIELIY